MDEGGDVEGNGEVSEGFFLGAIADEGEAWRDTVCRSPAFICPPPAMEGGEGVEEEGEVFDGVEAADVADDGGALGPRELGGEGEGGGGEAVGVDAVGDDLAEPEGAGDAVEDGLCGDDEGVGEAGDFSLEGPVPAGGFLEGVEGLEEEGARAEEGEGSGGEGVGVDEHGIEDVGLLMFKYFDEFFESKREVGEGGEVEGVDGDVGGGEGRH
jgi:hypothetical protein